MVYHRDSGNIEKEAFAVTQLFVLDDHTLIMDLIVKPSQDFEYRAMILLCDL